jgi:hypothetical protein
MALKTFHRRRWPDKKRHPVGAGQKPLAREQARQRRQSGLSFGSDGGRNGQFDEPGDLVISSEGNIYVADTGNNRIQASAATVFSSGVRQRLGNLQPRPWPSTGATPGVLDTNRATVTFFRPMATPCKFGGDKLGPTA